MIKRNKNGHQKLFNEILCLSWQGRHSKTDVMEWKRRKNSIGSSKLILNFRLLSWRVYWYLFSFVCLGRRWALKLQILCSLLLRCLNSLTFLKTSSGIKANFYEEEYLPQKFIFFTKKARLRRKNEDSRTLKTYSGLSMIICFQKQYKPQVNNQTSDIVKSGWGSSFDSRGKAFLHLDELRHFVDGRSVIVVSRRDFNADFQPC